MTSPSLDDVFLAFQPQLAGFLGALLAFVGDVVVVGDDFGANESLLEIGVNHAGCLRRGRADLAPSRRGLPSHPP